MVGRRRLRAAAVALGAVGGGFSALCALLGEQGRRARLAIGVPEAPPLRADGVYSPADLRGIRPSLRFAVVGDSMAAGLGVDRADELPGVLMARGLAEESERPVRLTTYAISGSATRDLRAQVDRVLHDQPDVALVIVGANDVTTRVSIGVAVSMLGDEVLRMRLAGIGVVVGTCPDLGAIRPIAQPLRSVARSWSLRLAKEQRGAVERAGGIAVALGDLLSPEFLARPGELFSADRFHPNAAGYDAAAAVLLAPLCSAAGVWHGGPLPEWPRRSVLAEARRPTSRVVAWVNRRR
ncbi:SGNH/GDSL hydrolase family protein [Umezawaea sp. Da 62-37]|uniref:SGNH/GDSL hydrolase family protein n=1 Tax=Umezawaea sp. Da 62-37 TaxID=3075927 RepID=UPI0028F74800|nr:SGNH/GDSL hydrolase family protein [Umezawaea sp. Da 62-37]WNV82326.1 SGNH/GDSL hydrolase family protein [Umezawaea sp. Da 62-37]